MVKTNYPQNLVEKVLGHPNMEVDKRGLASGVAVAMITLGERLGEILRLKYATGHSAETLSEMMKIPKAEIEKLEAVASCALRLHRDLFFEPIELSFVKNDDEWSIFCSENLYVSLGDSRKLMTFSPKHGDIFTIKCLESNNDAFTVEFIIDFDNGERNYERAIDVSKCSTIRIGSDNQCQIKLRSPYVKNDLIELQLSANGYELHARQTSYGVYYNGTKVNSIKVVNKKQKNKISK